MNFKINVVIRWIVLILSFLVLGCQQTTKEKDIIEKPLQKKPTIKSIENEPKVFTYDTLEWFNIKDIAPDIDLDIRYASENNFIGESMYDCAACYLRPEVAYAVVKIHNDLIAKGYGGVKLFDCYRPRPYQQRLWDKVPDPRYVSHPSKGSMHTRGAAVDLTIIDTEGNELDMGTDFDSFSKEAYHSYKHDSIVLANRSLLKSSMYKRGFKHITTEWWHYSYTLKNYVLSDWVWDCN